MPPLSADALGFTLQLDDQLTPGLARAAKNYGRFTKDLDRLNQRAVRSIGKAFGQMADLAETFDKMPQTIVAAYKKTAGAVRRQQKPLKIKVELTGVKGGRLDKEIAGAVTTGLKNARRAASRGQGVGALPVMVIPSGGYQRTGNGTPLGARVIRSDPRASRSMRDSIGLRQSIATAGMPPDFAKAMRAGMSATKGNAAAARQNLLTAWMAMTPGERKKAQGEFTKTMGTLRTAAAHERDMVKSTGLLGRSWGMLRNGVGSVAGYVKGIASSATEIGRNTRFTAIITALDRFGGLFTSSNQFFQGMNELNKSLHLSRKDLALMEEHSLGIAKQFDGVLDAGNVKDAMMALAKYGTRAREEFSALAPTVALATQAMDISGDTAAMLARKLGSNLKMSGSAVSDVFADISRISGKTGVSAEELAGSMADNAQRGGAFFKGLAPGARQGALTNMAMLQGVLQKNFGDSGGRMGAMMADALSDAGSDAARNIANLTGMTGGSEGSLGKAIQSGDIQSIIEAIGARARQAGTNSTAATQMAAALGFPGTGGEFMQFGQTSGGMVSDLAALQGSAAAAGSGFARLAEDAGKASSALDKVMKTLKNFITDVLPAWMLQGLGEISTSGTGLAAGGFLASQLGRVPVLGGFLRSLPGVGGLFAGGGAAAAAAGSASKVAPAAAAAGARAVPSVLSKVLGVGAGAAGLLTMTNSLGMSQADEDRLMGGAPRGTASGNAYGTLQSAAMRAAYAKSNPLMAAIAGTDYSAPGLMERANAMLADRGITPANAGSFGSPDMSPDQILMSTPVLPMVAKQQMDAAKAAAEASARDDMMRFQMMGMGAGAFMGTAPRANGPSAVPARPTPPDTVTRAIAEGRY